jgi:hypothetical protein
MFGEPIVAYVIGEARETWHYWKEKELHEGWSASKGLIYRVGTRGEGIPRIMLRVVVQGVGP